MPANRAGNLTDKMTAEIRSPRLIRGPQALQRSSAHAVSTHVEPTHEELEPHEAPPREEPELDAIQAVVVAPDEPPVLLALQDAAPSWVVVEDEPRLAVEEQEQDATPTGAAAQALGEIQSAVVALYVVRFWFALSIEVPCAVRLPDGLPPR
jgi:hypothetical protein